MTKTEFISRIKKEYENFISSTIELPSAEIIVKAQEISFKKELLEYFKNSIDDFDDQTLVLLCGMEDILDELYLEWEYTPGDRFDEMDTLIYDYIGYMKMEELSNG